MKEKKLLIKKNTILIILIILIILSIVSLFYFLISNNNNDTSKKLNNDIYDEKQIENLKIKITEITYEDDYSDILLDVINNSNDSVDINDLKIIFKDNDNNTIAELCSYNNGIIKVGESKSLSLSIDKDVTGSTKVIYELIMEN